MKPQELLDILHTAERLKDATRHCTSSGGKPESVAEHSWRTALMAFLLKDEFPEADMDKVLKMCLIHDLGEAFTGDIPSFYKTESDEAREKELLFGWICGLSEPTRSEMAALFAEMAERKTQEAKIFKALDNLEAVIQHNESPLSTWLPMERELNQTYGAENCAFSPYFTKLRELLKQQTQQKLRQEAE